MRGVCVRERVCHSVLFVNIWMAFFWLARCHWWLALIVCCCIIFFFFYILSIGRFRLPHSLRFTESTIQFIEHFGPFTENQNEKMIIITHWHTHHTPLYFQSNRRFSMWNCEVNILSAETCNVVMIVYDGWPLWNYKHWNWFCSIVLISLVCFE